MTDEGTPRFGGIIPSGTGLTNSVNQSLRGKRRRPLGLVLKKDTKPTTDLTAITNFGSKSDAFQRPDCEICLKSLVPNPQLCNSCQIWNDLNHVFVCLQNGAEWEKLPHATFGEMLTREGCLMCQAICEAVSTRFRISDEAMQEELLKVRIKNIGPYSLGIEALNDVDPTVLQEKGRSVIEPNDLRLLVSQKETELKTQEIRNASSIPIMLYLVLEAPRGSSLRQHFPELDELKSSEATLLGIHRVPVFGGDGLLQPTIALQLKIHYTHEKTQLYKLESWDNTYMDTNLLTRWIKGCYTDHGERCEIVDKQMDLPEGFKAIDTRRLCIVDIPSSPIPSYAALSYTWGATAGVVELQLERANHKKLQETGSLKKFGGIPDVILDSITLCASMGQKYLWVDRLCIIQDDISAKMGQIESMDRIYHGAAFTIVAATPLGAGLPGVIGRPRKSGLWNHTHGFQPKLRFIGDNFKSAVMDSFWNTRGWTYQEHVLSRRVIFITGFQAYFYCKNSTLQEDIGDFAAPFNHKNFHKIVYYFSSVVIYTVRNLSYESDILNAFAGIGNHYAKAMGKPLLFGLSERYFPQSLLWENRDQIAVRDEAPEIPSWSWAAWKGGVLYDMNSNVEKLTYGSLVRFYFQDPVLGLRLVEADEFWFFKKVELDELEKFPAIDEEYPEMRFMPNSKNSEDAWRECPHNPWEVARNGLDTCATALASAYPGCLVFATTSAKILLRLPNLTEDSASATSVRLDIHDKNQSKIGNMAQMNRLWIEANLNLHNTHEIIVISAGIVREMVRYTYSHSTISKVSGVMHEPNLDGNPWYLHVMLIRRDESCRIVRRLGIGVVEMRAWKCCSTEWSTVVLV